METRAVARYIRTSPSKLRRYVDSIRGQQFGKAVALLEFMPSPSAAVVKKLLVSAGANAEERFNVVKDGLYVDRASVDPGPTLKRYRAGSMGRGRRIRKRTAHITIWLSDQKPKKK